MTTALIYVPAADQFDPCADACTKHCKASGYTITTVIRGDWETAWKMLCDGSVSVIVVARPDHLPSDAQPRVEVAYHGPVNEDGRTPKRRRPRPA